MSPPDPTTTEPEVPAARWPPRPPRSHFFSTVAPACLDGSRHDAAAAALVTALVRIVTTSPEAPPAPGEEDEGGPGGPATPEEAAWAEAEAAAARSRAAAAPWRCPEAKRVKRAAHPRVPLCRAAQSFFLKSSLFVSFFSAPL